MKSWLVILAVAAGAALSLPAQAVLGQAAPPLAGVTWQRGAPIAPGSADAPVATVFGFYGAAASARFAGDDAAHLARLQREWQARGVRVVAVFAADAAGQPVPLGEEWQPCSVVQDVGEIASKWLGEEQGALWHIAVVDRRAQVVFLGRPGAGLVDALEATVSGQVDLEAERQADGLRRLDSFDDAPFELLQRDLDAALRHAPHDGVLAGLRYALHAHRGDRTGARAALEQDLPRLQSDGSALGAFADLVLRADPTAPGVAAVLCDPLAAAASAAPRDTALVLAQLRALVLARRGRDVGRQVMRARKLALANGDTCLSFAEILAQAEQPAIYADLANQALQRAAELEASPRALAAARFVVARRCGGDAAAAQAVFAEYVERLQLRVSINNDCWYFLTELASMGRYDVFAAALADRMLEQKDAMDYFEFDTAALAMFRVGRLADAVELQEQAIEKGGKDDADYRERLARYKAAMAAAPR